MNKVFVEFVLNNSTQLAITVSPADILELVYEFISDGCFNNGDVDGLNRWFWEFVVDHRRIRITNAHYKQGHFIISEHTKEN